MGIKHLPEGPEDGQYYWAKFVDNTEWEIARYDAKYDMFFFIGRRYDARLVECDPNPITRTVFEYPNPDWERERE